MLGLLKVIEFDVVEAVIRISSTLDEDDVIEDDACSSSRLAHVDSSASYAPGNTIKGGSRTGSLMVGCLLRIVADFVVFF